MQYTSDDRMLQAWPTDVRPALEAILFARGAGASIRISPVDGTDVLIVGATLNPGVMPAQEIESTTFVASAKHAELIATGARATPASSSKHAPGFIGGLRASTLFGEFAVAVSGLPGHHDVVLAALAALGLEQPLCVNHYGIRYSTEDAWLNAMELDSGHFIRLQQSDHTQAFAALGVPKRRVMREHQWWPDRDMPHLQMHHVDVAVDTYTPTEAGEWLQRTISQAPVRCQRLGFQGLRPGPICGLRIHDTKPERDWVLDVHFREWEDRAWAPQGIK